MREVLISIKIEPNQPSIHRDVAFYLVAYNSFFTDNFLVHP